MTEALIIILGITILITIDLLTIGFYSAFLQASQARLLKMREQNETVVNRTLNYVPLPPRLKTSISLVLVLVRFGVAGLLLLLYSMVMPGMHIAALAGLLLIAALVLFVFEWGVDWMATRNPEKWAIRLLFFVRLLVVPLSYIFVPFGISGQAESANETASSVTEDDLKSLVDAGEEEGVFEQDERRMIYSIFQLGDTLVREIMVPRIDMLTLDVNTPLPEAVDAFLESGHSRLPVHQETVDNTLGLLYAKDLLKVWREGNKLQNLKDLLRPAFFVPEAKKADELLTEMQSQRFHMAVVVDEYGGVAGLVTLEDVVEEILGEIQDEYDQGEESPYQVTQDGDYLFLGRIDIDDFNEIMGCQLPTDDADTLGGYIYSRLGHVPNVGENVQSENLLLTVEQVSAHRIRKVKAIWLPADGQHKKEEHHVNR